MLFSWGEPFQEIETRTRRRSACGSLPKTAPRPKTRSLSPETRYAKTTDGVHIAYQIAGHGPGDLVFVPGFVFNVEQSWEWPDMARFNRRVARFSRLILFDRRGTGLSDHVVPAGQQLTLEVRMDDIRAVMDAAESERATLLGFEEGFALCTLFAATYPERVAALVGIAPAGLGRADAEQPWAYSDEIWAEYFEDVRRGWGTLEFAEAEGRQIWPEIGDDREYFRHYAAFMRRSVSPGDALLFLGVDSQTDVRGILPSVRTPTLLVQRANDRVLPIEYGRYFADKIPGAALVELPGSNHSYAAPDHDEVLDHVEQFLKALRAEEAELDRVLATVLFTDIVESTKRAAALGDRSWRALLEKHHIVRGMLARYRGAELDTAGDGFFATFDGPARAVKCAISIVEAVEPLGLEIRAGLHTGEVETIDDKVGGIAVAIGERICSLARPSEVVASSTVKDLVAGSYLQFEEAGEHELKGVPGRSRLYRVLAG
jgi:pimeloyl-ACP methyl ester carboxylesterase